MDAEVLKMLAQFRILLKKEKQASIDFEKFVADMGYARSLLGLAEESDNEILVELALSLRDKLGLLLPAAARPAPAAAVAPKAEAAPDPKAGKYRFGARS